MLSLIRPPNGITERAREVLALLCNPTLYTRHSFQPTTPSGTTSPTFHPNSLVSTRIPGGIRLAFASLGRCWSEGCGRRLGDLRSDFKLYLGMDRSIYLGGVSAIMHGLTVSVAAKLTPLRRAAVQTCTSLSLSMSPFSIEWKKRKRRGIWNLETIEIFLNFLFLFLFFRVFVSKIEREIDLNFAAELERGKCIYLPSRSLRRLRIDGQSGGENDWRGEGDSSEREIISCDRPFLRGFLRRINIGVYRNV